jgi:nucleotide-binding universal stress UspA family protein
MLFARILFPFDYSDRCRHATPFVESLIEKTGARLTMLNVIEAASVDHTSGDALVVPQSVREEILASSAGFLREYAREAFRCYAVDTVCRMGDPAKEIIRMAAESHIDLIMMPTRGCGRFRRLLLGSATAKVLDDAKCPVWTDAHRDQSDRAPERALQNILCAVEGNEESVSTIRWASDLASLYCAKLRLIHVIPELDPGLKLLRPEWVRDFEDRARAKITGLRDQAESGVEIIVREGTLSAVIREVAIESKADLLIMARGHLQSFVGRLKTKTYAIIRDSPCPVLSV